MVVWLMFALAGAFFFAYNEGGVSDHLVIGDMF